MPQPVIHSVAIFINFFINQAKIVRNIQINHNLGMCLRAAWLMLLRVYNADSCTFELSSQSRAKSK